jgi:hypothetical protein
MIQMSPHQGNQSEVAQFIQEWDAVAAAMQQGLNGLSLGSAQHAFISHNMDKALSKMLLPDVGPETQPSPETTA